MDNDNITPTGSEELNVDTEDTTTEGKRSFSESLDSLTTTDIAPKLPKKYPPFTALFTKGIVVLLLVAVIVFCAGKLRDSIEGYGKSDELYNSFAESWGSDDLIFGSISSIISKSDKNGHGSATQVYGSPTIPEVSIEDTDDGISPTLVLLRAKFAKLKQTNPDVIGWITVPDTQIDYPVVKTSDNDYYLDHSITGAYLNSGTIFVDYRNERDWTDKNTVIYGHNMASGAMFAHLAKFKSSSFLRAHPYIYIQTENGIYVYKVFSVYETNKYNPYIRIHFGSDNDFLEWAKSMKSSSLKSVSYSFKSDDRVITMSTCTNGFGDDGRLAVHAVLTEIRK